MKPLVLLFAVLLSSVISIGAYQFWGKARDQTAKPPQAVEQGASDKPSLNKHGVPIHECCGVTQCCGTPGCCDFDEKNKDDVCMSAKCPKLVKSKDSQDQ